MPQSQLKCLRCQGRMTLGFVLDRGDANAKGRQYWFQGIPQKSWWQGIRTSDLPTAPTVTYRCDKCGYLESYTDTEADD